MPKDLLALTDAEIISFAIWLAGGLTLVLFSRIMSRRQDKYTKVDEHNPGSNLFNPKIVNEIAARALVTYAWKPSHRSKNAYNKLAATFDITANGERYYVERGLPIHTDFIKVYEQYCDLPLLGDAQCVYFVCCSNEAYYWSTHADKSYWLTLDIMGFPREVTGNRLLCYNPSRPNNSGVFFDRDIDRI